MPGNDPGGIVMTVLTGIIGAVFGGFVWTYLSGTDRYGDLDIVGIPAAVLGSLALLGVSHVRATVGLTVLLSGRLRDDKRVGDTRGRATVL